MSFVTPASGVWRLGAVAAWFKPHVGGTPTGRLSLFRVTDPSASTPATNDQPFYTRDFTLVGPQNIPILLWVNGTSPPLKPSTKYTLLWEATSSTPFRYETLSGFPLYVAYNGFTLTNTGVAAADGNGGHNWCGRLLTCLSQLWTHVSFTAVHAPARMRKQSRFGCTCPRTSERGRTSMWILVYFTRVLVHAVCRSFEDGQYYRYSLYVEGVPLTAP
jgi:hypothetical protein